MTASSASTCAVHPCQTRRWTRISATLHRPAKSLLQSGIEQIESIECLQGGVSAHTCLPLALPAASTVSFTSPPVFFFCLMAYCSHPPCSTSTRQEGSAIKRARIYAINLRCMISQTKGAVAPRTHRFQHARSHPRCK